jgi:hypothetical protein
MMISMAIIEFNSAIVAVSCFFSLESIYRDLAFFVSPYHGQANVSIFYWPGLKL